MAATPAPPRRRILIVDDDPTIHKLLGKVLTPDRYELQSAFQGEEALALLPSFHPDLVVLDLMMPKVSGAEVCAAIKQDPRLKDIVVLILTAKESQEDRIKGLDLGADDYVAKPFHITALARKIEYMLEKKA